MGQNPYNGLITRTFPFNYPPTALLFLWPLGLLGYFQASVLWNLLSTSSVMASIWLLLKLVHKRPTVKLFLFTTFVFTIPFFPVKFNIGNGQINNFLLFFYSLAIFLYFSGRKNLSAGMLAFATGIKLAPMVMLLFFFLKKEYRLIVKFFVFLIFLYLLTFIFVPPAMHLDYWQKVFPLSFTTGAKDWYYNQSVWGFVSRISLRPWFVYFFSISLSALILLTTILRGRKLNDQLMISAVTTLYLLIHPIALQHYFGFAIIPFVFLFADIVRNGRGALTLLVLIFSYFLIATDIKNFGSIAGPAKLVLSHDFYGVLLLWVLCLWPKSSKEL